MIYVDHKITLDVRKVASPVFVRLKKKDSARRILAYLTEKSRPYQITEDCYAVFTAKKPDGKVIFNDCTIDGNTIIYEVTDQTTAAVGQFEAEIKLYGRDGKLITSPCFTIVVADTVYDEGDEIESTDEYNALAVLIERAQRLETTSALVCKVALPMVALEGMTVSIPVENMSRTPKVGEAFIAMAAKRYTVFQVVAVSQNTFAATVLASVDTGGTGADGFSPIASVTQTDTGAVITIIDKSGTTMATIVNGKDGKDGAQGIQGEQGPKGDTGAPGADGAKGDKGDKGDTGEPGNDGADGKDGSDGKDGVSATHSWSGTTLTITSASGTSSANLKGEKGDKGDQGIQGEKGDTGAPGSNGTNGKDGANGTSVTVKSVSESTADGGSNVVTFSDGKTLTVKNGSKGSTGGKGDTGATGQRGTGLLAVTTAPSSYTTAVGGITPKYRLAISTIKTQAGVTEVLLGDTVLYSYYHYPIDYLDASYAYFTERVSIRGATGAAGAAGKDYSFDPTVYGLPILELTGDTSPIAVSKDNKVTLAYVYGERSGSCTLKGQGATSYKTAQALVNAGKAGKFNYTINFDNAFEAKSGWGAQKKYCLKANFIDTTHSRNIVSCILFGMSVKARSTVPSQLANLPNGGAIDGFPVVVMLNGEFHGLYTWNIPKDGWMFGLVEDTTKTQAIVGADDHTTATQFKEASMTGFEVEFVSDEDNADWVNTSITRLISAVMNSDGSDLDTTVAQYLDWDSAIDHYIHTVVDKATDCVDKNYLLVTFDGVKWYMSAYDRDSIHGLNWDASGTTRPVSNVSFIECAESVKVYELIKRFKTNALKARYKELRSNILSESRIMEKFENFAWAMPSPVMLEDVKLYPTILGSSVNTIDQIGRFVRQRLVRCDEWIDALPAQESTGGSTVTTYAVTNALSNCVSSNGATAVNANAAYSATITASDGYTLDGASVTITMGGTNITSTAYSAGKVSIAKVTGAVVITISAVKKASGYTNLVPTSTDTDGSIYNGTGYKDNVRLSSSGGVSGTALTGSTTTGFIPCKANDVIRMKGATWVGTTSSNLYYINFYDSEKTYLTGYTATSYTGSYAGVTVEYDETTGITMWDTSTGPSGYLENMKSAAFFRINAYGSGADLIVTVNQEIT